MNLADQFRKAKQKPASDPNAKYETARENFEAARPDIEAGKLKAYPDWRSAEVALEGLKPKGEPPGEAEVAPQRVQNLAAALRERNGLTSSQRAETPDDPLRPVHPVPGAGMARPSWQSPVQMTRPNVRGVQEAFQQAQVHAGPPPLTGGGPKPQVPAAAPLTGTTPQPDSTMLAPRGARQAAAEPFKVAGRMAAELGGVTAAGRTLKVARPAAGPILKAGASAIGSAVGSLAAEPFDPSENPGRTAAFSAVFSGVGDSLALGFSALRKARSQAAATRPARVVLGGARAMELLGDDYLPSPGRLSVTPTVDTFENVAENSILGGGRITARNERATARAEALIRQETSKYARGLSRAEVDQLVEDVTTGGNKAYRAAGDALYRELDGLAQEGVSTQPLIDLRNKIVAEFKDDARAQDLEGFVKAVDRVLGVPPSMRGMARGEVLRSTPSLKDLDSKAVRPNAADTITFSQMNSLRSAMLEVSRSGDALSPTVGMGQAKRIAQAADESLQTAGAALRNPDAFEAWREANRFWKELHGTFNDNVMVALANSRPDDLFNTIMQADSPQQIARFRKMVLGGLGGSVETAGEIRKAAKAVLANPKSTSAQKNLAKLRIDMSKQGEKAWVGFQGRYFMRLLENANKGSGIETAGARAGRRHEGSKLLDQWSAFGADSNAEVFTSPRQRRRAEEFFRTLEITQGGTGSQTGKLATQFGQAGSSLALIMQPGLKTAANAVVMLFGPEVIAKQLDDPNFIRWLTTAKRVKPGSEAHARAVVQVAISAAKAGARVVDSNGMVLDLEEEVPKAKEARDLLNLTNRR